MSDIYKLAQTFAVEVYAQGILAERKRIVELFEGQDDAAWFGLNKAAILLIKGELPATQNFDETDPGEKAE
jgi:hypothetical protein